MTARGRLVEPEEFGNIVLRANPDGSFVRLKDVARIELGAQDYDIIGRLNGRPAAMRFNACSANSEMSSRRWRSAASAWHVRWDYCYGAMFFG